MTFGEVSLSESRLITYPLCILRATVVVVNRGSPICARAVLLEAIIHHLEPQHIRESSQTQTHQVHPGDG
jgi:hypothetical protein